jgi:hypothetical protein
MRFSTRFNIFPATGKAKKGTNATAKGTVMTESRNRHMDALFCMPEFHAK